MLTDVKFKPTPYTCPACPVCGGSSSNGGSSTIVESARAADQSLVGSVTPSDEFHLSFTMFIEPNFVVATGNSWPSIIQIGEGGGRDLRQPALFFAPGGQLHVTLYDGAVQWGTYYAPATTDGAIFQAGQTYDVVVDCAYDASTRLYTQRTIIDGVTTDTTTSATRNLVAGKQPVYVGAPWHASADVVLTDVKFEPTPYTPLPCLACPACGGSSNSGGSGTASLAIVIPVVIAAVLLVAAILFLVYKRVVAARQHRRESMPTIAADEAEAEA